ncbi:TPA: hypothetical protein I8V74_002195 [Corynebacterium striatum]|nr:hypothetical protein [Corynebacterium striatum]
MAITDLISSLAPGATLRKDATVANGASSSPKVVHSPPRALKIFSPGIHVKGHGVVANVKLLTRNFRVANQQFPRVFIKETKLFHPN